MKAPRGGMLSLKTFHFGDRSPRSLNLMILFLLFRARKKPKTYCFFWDRCEAQSFLRRVLCQAAKLQLTSRRDPLTAHVLDAAWIVARGVLSMHTFARQPRRRALQPVSDNSQILAAVKKQVEDKVDQAQNSLEQEQEIRRFVVPESCRRCYCAGGRPEPQRGVPHQRPHRRGRHRCGQSLDWRMLDGRSGRPSVPGGFRIT